MNHRRAFFALFFGGLSVLSACTVQPLYGERSQLGTINNVAVAEVDNRVAQQVRNRLLFLLNGSGAQALQPAFEARLSVTSTTRGILSVATLDSSEVSARRVTVNGTMTIVDLNNGETLRSFTRSKFASYDVSSQQASNQRALLNAENRAAAELAEEFRTLIASTVSN